MREVDFFASGLETPRSEFFNSIGHQRPLELGVQFG
jgi:hypothetical protein